MTIFGFNFSTGDIWLLAVAGWLGSALIGFQIGLLRAAHDRYAVAAAKFRSVVIHQTVTIPGPESWGISYYKDRTHSFVVNVGVAADEFKPFLSARKRQIFSQDWDLIKKISAQPLNGGNKGWTVYRAPSGIAERQELHKRLQQMLAFAPEK